jgi:hypothetical protein
MSFPTTVYLSDEHVLTTSDSQKLPLGTRGVTSDGRIFRYAQAGAANLKAYMLCISAAEGPASTATDQWFNDDYAVGTTYIQMGFSTVALPLLVANYFKDGYLMCNSTDVAHNQICAIDSHPALSSGSCTSPAAIAQGIYLKPPGLKKLADTSTACLKLVANPYKFVVVSTDANGPGYAVGVTPCTVTTLYYFWLQTWGPSLAHAGEGATASIDKTAGLSLHWSTGSTGGVAGACGTTGADSAPFGGTDSGRATAQRVGTLMTCAPAANFFHMINLTIAP